MAYAAHRAQSPATKNRWISVGRAWDWHIVALPQTVWQAQIVERTAQIMTASKTRTGPISRPDDSTRDKQPYILRLIPGLNK